VPGAWLYRQLGMLEETGLLGGVPRRQPDVELTSEQQDPSSAWMTHGSMRPSRPRTAAPSRDTPATAVTRQQHVGERGDERAHRPQMAGK
jgi:hypothetical protein